MIGEYNLYNFERLMKCFRDQEQYYILQMNPLIFNQERDITLDQPVRLLIGWTHRNVGSS